MQAFIFSSAARSKREKTRNAEKEQRRLHVPIAERPVDEPPPFVVLVHGPPGVSILCPASASRPADRASLTAPGWQDDAH